MVKSETKSTGTIEGYILSKCFEPERCTVSNYRVEANTDGVFKGAYIIYCTILKEGVRHSHVNMQFGLEEKLYEELVVK